MTYSCPCLNNDITLHRLLVVYKRPNLNECKNMKKLDCNFELNPSSSLKGAVLTKQFKGLTLKRSFLLIGTACPGFWFCRTDDVHNLNLTLNIQFDIISWYISITHYPLISRFSMDLQLVIAGQILDFLANNYISIKANLSWTF